MIVSYLGTYGARAAFRFMPDVLWHVPSREPTLYLTFDDGPWAGTPDVLALLERYDASATFFLIGRHAEAHPDQVRTLHAAGHSIGNHTFTHPDAWKTPPEQILDELQRTGDLLAGLTGTPVRWMRPPYGRFTRAMRRWCLAQGQQMVLWDTLPADFRPSATVANVTRRVLQWARPGSIVVLHDNPKFHTVTLPALEHVLTVLSEKGWRFSAL